MFALATLLASSLVSWPAASANTSGDTSPAHEIPRTLDDVFYAVAKDIPEFAGVVVDEANGELEVRLTKPSATLATSAHATLLEHGLHNRSSSLRVTATAADYSFRDLKNWYDKIAQHILTLPGVVLTDIDETSNRLRVGMSDLSHEAVVRAMAGKQAVPQQALLVEKTEPIRQQQSLQDFHRPLLGGLQIALPNAMPGINNICTLGFIATRGNIRGFVTNSHCTQRRGVLDGDLVGQPNRNNVNIVATESIDPALFRNAQDANCPAGRRCRYSDTALISILAQVGSNKGWVAIPATGSPTWNHLSHYTIDRRGDAFAGSTVERIGRTTGLSRGPVTNTCVHVNVAGQDVTNLCQWIAQNTSAGGDSGGPVVAFEAGNNRTLRGIHWGGGSGSTAFSTIELINVELGGISVCAVGSC